MSILTSFTRPPAARTTFSSVGVSCLQGPHQVAQKSTRTGMRREASITSAMKLAWVPSTIISPGPELGAPPGTGCDWLAAGGRGCGCLGFWPIRVSIVGFLLGVGASLRLADRCSC